MYYSYGIPLLNTLVIDLNTVLLNTININVFKRVNVMPNVISKCVPRIRTRFVHCESGALFTEPLLRGILNTCCAHYLCPPDKRIIDSAFAFIYTIIFF